MPQDPADNNQIVEALRKIPFPGYSRDIVTFGFVKSVEVSGGSVRVGLQLSAPDPEKEKAVREAICRELGSLPGIESVQVDFAGAAPAAAAPRGGPAATQGLPGVSHLVAVASGKGGVGKSTVAVNLAVALARAGHAVGLLDSDIYGPSVPLMMGIKGHPETEGNQILPLENHGVRTMSIGYMLEDDAPVIWRGPMVMKALTQFLREVRWGKLDYLILDLPPGTGDAQLTLVQAVPLAGVVAVTTPQDVALLDARKAISMFRKTGVPILGLIENMSVFVCPGCGHEEHIFGRDGGRKEAERAGVPFLGEIPLHSSIREGGDLGTPIVVSDPDSAVAQAFCRIAATVAEMVQKQAVS